MTNEIPYEIPPELERFIHKLHLRSFDKIMPHVKEQFPNATPQQVKHIIKSFVKDPRHLDQRKYYNPIFSDHPHAWMMDLLDNKGQTDDYNNKAEKESKEMTKRYPLYWFIFININTKFAAAYPLYHKTEHDIKKVIERFVSEHKCVSLTSDKESSFISDSVKNYLKSKNISQYIVLDNNHTSLSVIDSFIRHLRDMNITNEKSKYQSHHSKYRNFSTHRMNELINVYNNTIHSTTEMKPIDMENDLKKEKQYIAYCLIRKMKSKNYDIPNGHFVRLILDKDVMKKRRFKVSRECYIISGRDGKNYFIQAADKTTRSVPRHKLIDLGKDKPDKYKLADTIPEGFRIPVSIVNSSGNKTYLVSFGDDVGYKDMKVNDLRRHHPQIESKLEKDFNDKTVIRINLNHE